MSEHLSPLVNEYTWGTGHLYDWEGLPFMPTFYGVGEYSSLVDRYNGVEMGKRLEGEDTIRFFVDEEDLPRREGRPWRGTEGYWHNLVALGPIIEGHWNWSSKELTHVGYDAQMSALHSAVQPALWLGFNPIYLLGFDLTDGYVYAPKMLRRLDNRPVQVLGHSREVLHLVKGLSEGAGKRIVNLSQGTNDTVLEKDTLENVLGVLV